MAENEDGQEKTERATPKRLQEAREKGQVPRSRELTTMAMLLMAAIALSLMGESMIAGMGEILRMGLDFERASAFDRFAIIDILAATLWRSLVLFTPFLLIMIATAMLAPIALGGWSFSTEAMSFKFDKLNPVAGMKRIFAARGLVELVKALAKFLLIGAVGALLLVHFMPDLLGLGRESVPSALAHTGQILSRCFLILSASLLLIAAIDVPFQLWDHARNLRMTRQEIRDEHKNTEGKPEVKSRVRAMQREIAQRRMMSEVPKADVVITNPTHYAVALRYDPATMAAPVVVAKGVELMASQIRTIATAHRVPLYEAPPLARALYYSTEIDQEVPGGLYLAVAQVLAYIFQLRAARRGGPVPAAPADIAVPEEFFQGPGREAGAHQTDPDATHRGH